MYGDKNILVGQIENEKSSVKVLKENYISITDNNNIS